MASTLHFSSQPWPACNSASCSRRSLAGGAGSVDGRTAVSSSFGSLRNAGRLRLDLCCSLECLHGTGPGEVERKSCKLITRLLCKRSAFAGASVEGGRVCQGESQGKVRPGRVSASLDSFPLESSNGSSSLFSERRSEQKTASRSSIASGQAVIKVIGIGGGGCNAVNEMVNAKLPNVEFWSVNTDSQALRKSLASNRLQIGRESTLGRGAGGSCEVGEEAATESLAELSMALEGADMVFIAAGMGGGTGSGAGPVVARLAKAMGALTVGIVTEPFSFEGAKRSQLARKGIEAMRNSCDTLVVVPNDRLLETLSAETSFLEAFHLADDVLRQGVQGISDIITVPGLVNVDFADVKAVMSNAGSAMLGIGVASGKNRAEEVARSAIMSPLLQSIVRPSGIVYNVTGGADLTLHEVNVAAEIIYGMADPNANVIFGAVIDESFKGKLRMTVIATGFREFDDGRPSTGREYLEIGPVKTIDDDISSWEQNLRKQSSTGVPEFLKKRAIRRQDGGHQ